MTSSPSKATNQQTSTIKASSPYYLHPSNNLSQVYISEQLNEGNYTEQMNDMSNALLAKNKIGFVDGTIFMLTVDSPNLSHWKRCNAMVKGWLKSIMDKDLRMSVRYAKTARETWQELKERFSKGSAPKAYELHHAVALLRQERLSVPAYYTKVKGLWDEMQTITPWPKCDCKGCKCNIEKQLIEMKERDQLYDFLTGLDESFNAVKTQILSTKSVPKLGNAYHLVAEDEQQRQVLAFNKPIIEVAAFQVQRSRGSKRKEGKKERVKCGHCQKLGHTKDRCYEIIRYPPDWRKGRHEKKDKGALWNNKKGPQVAQVSSKESPVPSLTQDMYNKLI